MPGNVGAQLYVGYIGQSFGTAGEYDATTGAAINASFTLRTQA